MNNFSIKYQEYKEMIENYLDEELPFDSTMQQSLTDAIKYSVCNAGKRIRGVLALSFYELFSNNYFSAALPFASSVEMVHAYSLIHDDLPCMDDDDIRRGKPSTHIAFGEATALLAGDALLTLAFRTISNMTLVSDFSSEALIKCVNILADKAGINGMVGGQALDLENETVPADIVKVEDTELKKTGALIAASCLLGAVAGGADIKQQEVVEQYGYNIGLAFQIIDDILDNTSTVEQLGKPIGSDKDKNKTTFTNIYGLEKSRNYAKQLTSNALLNLKSLNKNTDFLENFTLFLLDRNY